jgi:acetolactate synthase small subunit
LALHLAISIATGQKALGRYELEQGTVIYYALEDNQRRLQSRLIKLSEDGEITDGSQFLFMGCELARFDQGGLNDLKKAIQKHPDCRLIIIDTLGKFSPTPDKKLNAYEHDYRVIGEIQKLAMQKQIAIVLITHLRKQQASEALGRVMGSTGITGSADTIWLLVRKSGQRLGTLSITGRDIEDKEFALQFDEVSCEWTTQGDAAVVASTIERQEIIDILESSQFPLSPKEIAEELDKKPANIKALIHKMHKRGILEKVGHGKYRLRTPSDDFGNLSDKNLDMTRLQESNHWDETNQLDDLRDIIGE